MIVLDDMNELFRLIANYLKKDMECFAIGGTAMMYFGYKISTKDIDLVFISKKDRDEFIKAIKILGYREKALNMIYDEKRAKDKNRPLLFTRGDERFDLFLNKVFSLDAEKLLRKDATQRIDFLSNDSKHSFIIYLPKKEDIILFKAVTNREKDFEDILDIVKREKEIDWEYIVNKSKGLSDEKNWIIYDLEETLQKLKKTALIPKKCFDLLYKK